MKMFKIDKLKLNSIVNFLLGLSFIVTAITGLFRFGSELHEGIGTMMIILALIHIVLYWELIICRTKSFFKKNEKCE